MNKLPFDRHLHEDHEIESTAESCSEDLVAVSRPEDTETPGLLCGYVRFEGAGVEAAGGRRRF